MITMTNLSLHHLLGRSAAWHLVHLVAIGLLVFPELCAAAFDPVPIITRAKQLEAQGKYAEAVREYDKYVAAEMLDPIAHLCRGRMRYLAGDNEGALEDLEFTCLMNPKDAIALGYRGLAHRALKSLREATADFKAAVAADPTEARWHYELATCLLDANQQAAALPELNEAIRISPKTSDFYLVRAVVHRKLGHREEGLADCAKLRELVTDPGRLAQVDALQTRIAKIESEPATSLLPENADQPGALLPGRRPDPAKAQAKAVAAATNRIAVLPHHESSPLPGGVVPRALPAPASNARPKPAAPVRQPSRTANEDEGNALSSERQPSPAASASTQQGPDGSSTPVPAAQPSAPKTGNRLADSAFKGFSSDSPCDRKYWKMRGVPWKVDAAPDGAEIEPDPVIPIGLPSFGFEAYQVLVGRCKEAIGMIYGPLNNEEGRSFELLWAPFFDHPNAPCFDYFSKLLPLLDEYHRINAEAIGLEQELREDMDDAGMRAFAGDELGARTMLDSGYRHVIALKEGQQALGRTVAKIQSLGDPPNPLQQKCRARKQHKAAIGKIKRELAPESEYIKGWWVFKDRWTQSAAEWASEDGDIYSPLTFKDNTAESVLTHTKPKPYLDKSFLEWSDPPKKLRAAWGDEYPVIGGETVWVPGEKFKITMKVNHGYMHARWLVGKRNTFKVYHPSGIVTRNQLCEGGTWDAGIPSSPTAQAQATLEFEAPRLATERPIPPPEDQEAVFCVGMNGCSSRGVVFYRYEFLVDDSLTEEEAKLANQDQAKKDTQNVSPEPEDDEAKGEAVAQHLSAMKIIQANIAYIEKDLGSAEAAVQGRKPTQAESDRISQIAENLAVQHANLQSESDNIASLESGLVIKTRTAWDDLEHQRFVGKVQDEVKQLALENRLVARLPNYGNLVEGAEGVEAREWIQQSISAALKSKDRLGALQNIAGIIGNKIEAQQLQEQAKAQKWEANAQLGLDVSENVKGAADGAMLIGSLLFPPAGAVAMGYGIGVGAVEGGPSKAFENGIRAYSGKVDVIWAGYAGYYAKDEKGNPRGWTGAAEDAGTTFLIRAFMEKMGEKLHGNAPPPRNPYADVPKIKSSKPKREPVFDAYKDGNERLAEDLAGLKKKFGDADPARNTEYAKALEAVNQKHEIITKRQSLEKDIHEITTKYEEQIPKEARNADGSVKTGDPEYQKIKEEWQGEMKAAWDKHNVGYEGRMKQHLGEVEASGLKFVEARPEDSNYDKNLAQLLEVLPPHLKVNSKDPNWDLRMSGGNPKSIKSDIDMAARTLEGGQKFAKSMSDKGHNVLEYSDRWVITDTDTTVWKPTEAASKFPIKIGSSEHEAMIAYDTWPGSDKFPTEGGVKYTTGKGLFDPKGAVISNAKKASEGGIGGHSREPDLHVIGKSMVKSVEIANKTGTGDQIIEPDFMAKAAGVKEHQTAEQAGLVTFGNSKEAKKREADAWLDKARDILKRSYDSSAGASRKVESQYQMDLKAAIAAKDKVKQQQIREAMVRIRVSNESALRTIGGHDPKLVKDLMQSDIKFDVKDLSQIPAPPPPPKEGGYGYGWLWSNFRQDVNGAPPVPEPSLKGTTPDLQALSTRCGEAAKEIETNVLPKLKKGSPEAAHLTTLKTMLEQGQSDPIKAMRNARSVTGYELATVLKDVELPVTKK